MSEGTDATLPAGVGATLVSGSAPVDVDAPARDHAALPAIDPASFELGAEVARGGMGRIRLARDLRLGRRVAIKELLVDSADARARFEREARITARLQHPAIINIIEAGTWPSGAPFFVMRFVRGESLDRAIAGRRTLRERMALLANATAAVEALAYAHDQGVIHRDLKPANVLVGAFAETVVIDWGLAKVIADAGDDDDEAAATSTSTSASKSTSRSASATTAKPSAVADTAAADADTAAADADTADGETVDGAVLGTPAYMPPEQALGERLDARADVYALGAMLYHVLAGAPPYTGATAAAILAEVVARPPAPLDGAIPRELVTIVETAMARDPAARYATAKELAVDLARFQTGQLVGAHAYTTWQLVRRWMRRHRTALAVAGAALTVVVAVGVWSIARVVAAQHAADTNRARAESSMMFMLGDMRDRLQPLGRSDLIQPVGEMAVAYYDGLGELADAEREHQALAIRTLGDAIDDRGNHERALALYTRASAIAKALAEAAPDDIERQRDLRSLMRRRARSLLHVGRRADGIAGYREALAHDEAVARARPADAEWGWYVVASHARLGQFLAADANPDEGVRELDGAAAACRTAIARGPDATTFVGPDRKLRADVAWRMTLAEADEALTGVRAARGDVAGAATAIDEAIRLRREVIALAPLAENQVYLANAYARAATVSDHGDALQQAVTIDRDLASRDPGNIRFQLNLVVAATELASSLTDPAAAIAQLAPAIATATDGLAIDFDNVDLRAALARARGVAGDAELRRGEVARAIAEVTAGDALATELVRRAPSPDHALLAADVAARLGSALLAAHRDADARTAFARATALLQPLATAGDHRAIAALAAIAADQAR